MHCRAFLQAPQFTGRRRGRQSKSAATPCVEPSWNGEGGIRTHGGSVQRLSSHEQENHNSPSGSGGASNIIFRCFSPGRFEDESGTCASFIGRGFLRCAVWGVSLLCCSLALQLSLPSRSLYSYPANGGSRWFTSSSDPEEFSELGQLVYPQGKGRASSRPRHPRSSTTTRSACSRTATAGSARSRGTSRSTPPIGEPGWRGLTSIAAGIGGGTPAPPRIKLGGH